MAERERAAAAQKEAALTAVADDAEAERAQALQDLRAELDKRMDSELQ
jgi:hypothetical protein